MLRTMAVTPILRVLLFAVIARCRGDHNGYRNQNGKVSTQIGELLKPPPPPQLTSILPVPFHAPTRTQRHNQDVGYVYQPPPPPPPPPVPPSNDFKFPAPFYKQYNFNFVPPPQPFTTPASSLFNKVSGWLFPSQEPQTSYGPAAYSSSNVIPGKKDCNPCNLVPWIPVIRYDVSAKQQKNLIPTYGPPSPTAYAQNFPQFKPQPFQQQPTPGVPHKVYGPPAQSQVSTLGTISSTYGPPSPTHTLAIASESPPSSTYGVPSSSYGVPSSSYGIPSSSYSVPSSFYGVPSSLNGYPSSSNGYPSSSYGLPSSSYGVPGFNYGGSSSTFTPSQTFNNPSATGGFEPATPNYEPSLINNHLPPQNDVDILKDIEPSGELRLPKVTQPTGFRNSYGEPITNTYAFNIPYPVSATAAESTKVKTEVLPHNQNSTLALANPAPFSIKGGRNIHTLQPVALPNLSVSPLPPIFNARPFRPITGLPFIKSMVQGIDHLQKPNNVQQSVALTDFTHSIDYPPTYTRAPIIDIDATKIFNQSKAYRNINSGYVDQIRDVSSQASEDHVSAAKTTGDVSFESTGPEYGNDLYDNVPSALKYGAKIPSNYKVTFADLRGVKDEDVDKYRTENNLQNIDSPLLYLKPSAPHKDFESFVLPISTPGSISQEYEMYDDTPTTEAPNLSTLTSAWEESRNEYNEGLVPPPPSSTRETKPKIVQIIVPYTTGQGDNHQNHNYNNQIQDWTDAPEDEYQGRKVPTNTENPYANSVTESYSTFSTTTEPLFPTVTDIYDSNKYNTHAILNDLYDVKEPPFDIIKLQHNIDDWTVQEYSKRYKPGKTRTTSKYAKQIPDEYFTTITPMSYVTAASNRYNYEYYDHEGSSSMRHTVTNEEMNTTKANDFRQYNYIEKTKAKHSSGKNEDEEDAKKPHIYTAASSFRSTSTTSAPWGAIQTSISPLTKEKVYVVTSKPWHDTSEKPKEWYEVENFDSKKTSEVNDVSERDSLPFKSPRFSNRPSFGFSAGSGSGNEESLKSDSSYAFSKSWHQSINELGARRQDNSTEAGDGGSQDHTTPNSIIEENETPNMEEIIMMTTTGPHEGKIGK